MSAISPSCIPQGPFVIQLLDFFSFSKYSSLLDYANPAYAALGLKAQEKWRAEWGAENRYQEVGLCLTAEAGQDDYVVKSLENVRALEGIQAQRGLSIKPNAIQSLSSYDELVAVTGTGGASGLTGYINRSSGWADAESSMRWLRKRVMAYRRVGFLSVGVEKLVFDNDEGVVAGVELCDGNYLSADLIIVAAGAWSGSLIDLTGRVTATGQVLGYVELTAQEAEVLSRTPVQLNMSNGVFGIPPPHPSKVPQPTSQMGKGTLYLKIARHAWGYANPTTISHPENNPNDDKEALTISLPHTNPNNARASQPIPQEGEAALRSFLRTIIPPTSRLSSIAERPFAFTRICHYADTPDGDFLIDYHPKYGRSLFIATGGSGHGFKFLPVIGDKIVDCMQGNCLDAFKDKWAWKEAVMDDEWTLDGSRSGTRGMILKDELAMSGLKL
jgi:sarcosine oxidase/L-pipecolate oxidase